MLYRTIRLSLWGIMLAALNSCTQDVPEGILPADELENLLYDYHIAQGMAQQQPSDSVDYYTRLYQQAVYAKYGIDADQFDRTIVWYSRHTKSLGKIYDRLSERMGNPQDDEFGKKNMKTEPGVSSGDTINFWHGKNFVMLSSKGLNRYTFTEKNDTLFKYKDRLLWNFDVKWHYNEGNKLAFATLMVHYEGDSIAYTNQSIYSSGQQYINIRVANKKVKSVEGFIYQSTPWTAKPRIMTISDISLVRIRSKENEPSTEVQIQATPSNGDTLARPKINHMKLIRDSLLREEEQNERRPHFKK